jgi:hypothetical protein
MDLGDNPLSFQEALKQEGGPYLEPVIEICFKSNQKVRALLRSNVTLWCLRSNEGLVRIFRKRGCVQGERRARHNQLGESLVMNPGGCKRVNEARVAPRAAYVQQLRTSEHAFLHARVQKVDVIA